MSQFYLTQRQFDEWQAAIQAAIERAESEKVGD